MRDAGGFATHTTWWKYVISGFYICVYLYVCCVRGWMDSSEQSRLLLALQVPLAQREPALTPRYGHFFSLISAERVGHPAQQHQEFSLSLLNMGRSRVRSAEEQLNADLNDVPKSVIAVCGVDRTPSCRHAAILSFWHVCECHCHRQPPTTLAWPRLNTCAGYRDIPGTILLTSTFM